MGRDLGVGGGGVGGRGCAAATVVFCLLLLRSTQTALLHLQAARARLPFNVLQAQVAGLEAGPGASARGSGSRRSSSTAAAAAAEKKAKKKRDSVKGFYRELWVGVIACRSSFCS